MRTALRTILLAIREAWNPTTALFANGEVGVFYDCSDLTTMFQDSAGTTPVTAVEQPVGKILDKSGRGNHATQATSTKRPVLSARVNLLTKTEDFGDAAWIPASVSVTPNAIAAPDGTVTADMLSVIAACAFRTIDITVLASSNYTFTFYAYRGTASELKYSVYNTSALADIVSATSFYSQTVAGAWSKVTLNFTTPVGCTSIRLFPIRDPGVIGTCYIWGASLVPADQAALPYQRVNTATDYDTVGFKHYLKFDGVDDALVTNAIDFTATDKMTVVAGVRKLSDAATNLVVVELGVRSAAGSFGVYAPGGYAAGYTFTNQGVSQSQTNSPLTYTAPITNVITGVGEISADVSVLRINGIQAATSASDQGTGNYGNYPLYIGSRGGTSLPFNGHLYSLLIRGAQSTDAQIVSAETYVNSKTGAY